MSDTSIPVLKMLNGKLAGKSFMLENEITTIGRSRKADIAVQDDKVSGLHLRIFRREGDTFSVEDLGSRNGTHLNNEPIVAQEPIQLNEEDVIAIGDTECLFTKSDFDNDNDSAYNSDEIRQRVSATGAVGWAEEEKAKGTMTSGSTRYSSASQNNSGEAIATSQYIRGKVDDDEVSGEDARSDTEYTGFVDIEDIGMGDGEFTEALFLEQNTEKKNGFKFIAGGAVVVLLLFFLAIILSSGKSDGPKEPVKNIFETNALVVAKPKMWRVVDRFTTNSSIGFVAPESNFKAAFFEISDTRFFTAPLWLDGQYLKKVLDDFSRLAHPVIEDIGSIHLTKVKPSEWKAGIQSVLFWGRSQDGKVQHYGQLAFVRNVALLYYSSYSKERKNTPSIIEEIPKYIKLKNPYDAPFFKRPFIKHLPVNTYEKLADGTRKLEEAVEQMQRMAVDDLAESKVLIHMFQSGLRLMAESGKEPPGNIDIGYTLSLYEEVLHVRRKKLKQLKGIIIQKEALGDLAGALDEAQRLFDDASLASEKTLRQWAWKTVVDLKGKQNK